MEVILTAIKNNPEIKPITMPSLDMSKDDNKVFAFADDVTAIVSDKQSVQALFDTYEEFSEHSGVYLNSAKTEILKLGNNINVDNVVCSSGRWKHRNNSSQIMQNMWGYLLI